MVDVREITKYYSGPGFDEKEISPIGHGPLSKNITFATCKKDGKVFLLIDLGRENGKIKPKLVTDYTSFWPLANSEAELADAAYNIAMTMLR